MDEGLWGPTYVPGRVTPFAEYNTIPFIAKEDEIMNNSIMTTPAISPIDIRIRADAAITVTNQNLINIQARLNKDTSQFRADRRKIILQSEANSIFKGNFIRMLKLLWNDSTIVNRMKSSLEFTIDIGELHSYPYISYIKCRWYSRREYVPSWEATAKDKIMEGFALNTPSDYMVLGELAIKEHKSLPQPIVTQVAKEVKDVNFDSIKNIKF